MINKFYVYIYERLTDGTVFYVGKGTGDRAFKGKRNPHCENVKRKHGYKILILAENLSELESFNLEIFLISHYRNKYGDKLTNRTNGGEGVSGYIQTEQDKMIKSIRSKERWENEEFRIQQTKYRNNPDSVYHSEGFKKKLSSVTKGELNGNYGNKWTDEMKKSLSEKKKGKNLLSDNPNSKRIMCVETGVIYDTIKEAMIEYGVKHQSSFTVALKHPTRTAGGKHWVLVD